VEPGAKRRAAVPTDRYAAIPRDRS
jgi:hypothetical protein